jgi:hypothetical protein
MVGVVRFELTQLQSTRFTVWPGSPTPARPQEIFSNKQNKKSNGCLLFLFYCIKYIESMELEIKS